MTSSNTNQIALPTLKQFSHSCVKEGAKIEKARIDSSEEITKESFLAEVDSKVFSNLHKHVSICSNATYHRSADVVYVDNGDMSYIFK